MLTPYVKGCKDLYSPTVKQALIENPPLAGSPVIHHQWLLSAFCFDGDNFWIPAFHFTMMYKINKNTLKIEHMGSLLQGETPARLLYYSAAILGNKLYFAPWMANGIAVFDMDNCSVQKISLAAYASDTMAYREQLFLTTVAYGGSVYFVGFSFPGILKYDPCQNRLERYDDFLSECALYIDGKQPACYFGFACVAGSKIIAPIIRGNAVLIFDMETHGYAVHAVGCEKNRYKSAAFDGTYAWLTPKNHGPIVRWDPKTLECQEYGDYPNEFSHGDNISFLPGELLGGFLWLLPYRANMALKLDVASGAFSIADAFSPEGVLSHHMEPRYEALKVAGGKLYAFKFNNFPFIEYDPITGLKREPSGAQLNAAAMEFFIRSRDFPVLEDTSDMLDYFCDNIGYLSPFIRQPGQESSEVARHGGAAGKAIYEICKKAVFQL